MIFVFSKRAEKLQLKLQPIRKYRFEFGSFFGLTKYEKGRTNIHAASPLLILGV